MDIFVFIDQKKAFDTIDHQIILKKISKITELMKTGLSWFESYVTDRTQKCQVNEQLSGSAPVTYGVPQSSNLGPLLFLVCTNDLPNYLNHSIPRIFADDTSVSSAASSVGDLENVINLELKSLNSWLIANKLSLNIPKTEFITLGSRQKMATINDELAIKINDCEINRVASVKALRGIY